MSDDPTLLSAVQTLSFEDFWAWVQVHPNCILRGGTATTMLFDDEDYHWHFGVEDDDTYLVQMIRGKRIVGELVLQPSAVAYVQVQAQVAEEFVFDLVPEGSEGGEPLFHFVLTHGYDDAEEVSSGRWTH